MSTTFRRTRTGLYVPRGPVGYRDNVLADTPALYWRFSEAAGTAVADASGNGRDGTVLAWNAGAATTVTRNVASLLTGDADPAISFTGNGDQVNILPAVWMTAAAYTFECLFKVTDNVDRTLGCIDEIGNSSQMKFRILTSGNKLYCLTYQGTTLKVVSTPAATIVNGTRYHAAVVLNSATTTIDFYLNGALSASTAGTNAFAAGATSRFRVGGFADPSQAFKGTIDEVALYTSALSPARIAAHAAAA